MTDRPLSFPAFALTWGVLFGIVASLVHVVTFWLPGAVQAAQPQYTSPFAVLPSMLISDLVYAVPLGCLVGFGALAGRAVARRIVGTPLGAASGAAIGGIIAVAAGSPLPVSQGWVPTAFYLVFLGVAPLALLTAAAYQYGRRHL